MSCPLEQLCTLLRHKYSLLPDRRYPSLRLSGSSDPQVLALNLWDQATSLNGHCQLATASFHFLVATKCPSIAAAAAIMGLTRCVRPPLPCRPSKFRFEVEALRSPLGSTS